MPQLQYKNPSVQCITFKNMTPSPFIRCYFGKFRELARNPLNHAWPYILDDGKEMIIDIDSKNRLEIEKHLINVVGKSEELLAAEAKAAEKKDNPANFGIACSRGCICEIAGQVPCPGVVPVPYHMRGKYKNNPKED